MRLLPVLLVAPLWAFQAAAQPSPPAPVPPPAQSATPHHRMSWQERFAQANLTHDGHLTLEQAKGGYLSVARHFTEIDADKKGYVTEADVTAWHKLQRAMHHPARTKPEDPLRPRPAMQRGAMEAMPPAGDGASATPPDQRGAAPPVPAAGGGEPAPPRPGA